MPIDLPLLPLGSWFPKESWPQLPCGECSTGSLQVGTPNDIDVNKRFRDHEAWEPEWISGHFTVEAVCINQKCNSTALIAGRMKVDVDVNERGHWNGEYEMFFEVQYCEPPLRLLRVPERTPEDVKGAVVAASKVIWLDPSSGANRLRSATEYLLDDLGVPSLRSAHARIERLGESRSDVATVLEAVKWIGNDGSHTAGSPLKDVLEGVLLFEHALELVYDDRAEELTKRAEEINSSRRPTKPAPA